MSAVLVLVVVEPVTLVWYDGLSLASALDVMK